MKGTVKFFKQANGYGFITGEDNQDYFFHVHDIEGFNDNYPVPGQTVEFAETKTTKKGTAAKKVVLVGKER